MDIKLEDLLGAILTNNVNISDKKYAMMLNKVARTYDKNNDIKQSEKPSLQERRERVKSNFYGSVVNLLFQILSTVNSLAEVLPIIYATAEKVGVEFETVETEEEKAMKAAAEFLQASAEKKRAEAEAVKEVKNV